MMAGAERRRAGGYVQRQTGRRRQIELAPLTAEGEHNVKAGGAGQI